MLVIPAIDILDGVCVRLFQGDYSKARQYADDPVDVARQFVNAGAERIHIVDLDAARGKGRHNREAIHRVAKSVSVEIEVGGGIRSEDDVISLIDAGVGHLILGTVLVKDEAAVERWIGKYGARFIAGIDARDGQVNISGWEQDSMVKDVDLAVRAAELGFEGIIYTNIAVDGTLSGPDLDRTNRIAEVSDVDVILSGGISGPDDVRRVKDEAHHGIIGMITGKALYEGSLKLEEALAICGNGDG